METANELVPHDPKTGEIMETSNAPAPITMQLLAKLGVKVVKQVTRTVLQQRENVPFCVKFEGEMHESVVQEGVGRGGKPKMAPAQVADVLEYVIDNDKIVEGSKKILIANTVLQGELDRAFPDKSYVGKSFLINGYFPTEANGEKRRYKVYEIIEISVDGGAVEGKEIVADASDPVNAKGNKPKG